jgi:glycosyltransferase involved in cell wall biosynthesis
MAMISIAIMTHDEAVEFRWLMEALMPALDVIDEIVIVDDFSGPEFTAAVRELEKTMPLRFVQRALGKNFAAQRNYMKSLCRGKLIFFLDPDELPTGRVLRGLPKIQSVDLRDEALTIVWEDQFRMLRNLPHLYWTMRLNEYLTGVQRGYRFPHSLDYALLHCKTQARQDRQWVFYRSIRMRHWSRIKNSIFKRIPWRTKTQWVEAEAPI